MSALLPILHQYVVEDPEDPFNHYGYALELTKVDPDAGYQYLLGMLEQFPTYLATYYTVGSMAIDREFLQEAISIFEKGIALAQTQGNAKAESELKRALLNAKAEL